MYSLNIKQFKCFKNIDIPINKLTVFAGANGVGKSTAIQALLLLRQTIEKCAPLQNAGYKINDNEWRDKEISLNGNYCLALGNTSHILYRDFIDNQVQIGLNKMNEILSVIYEIGINEPSLYILPRIRNFESITSFHPITKKEFYYLNAERFGPRIQQSLSHQKFLHAGWKGENTAQLLKNIEYVIAKDNRRLPEGFRLEQEMSAKFIKDQVNEWLFELLDGVRVSVTSNPNTLSAQILLENDFTLNEPTLSTNLGFGVSYLLPILANALIAENGAFLIIENPEAHLHPAAQSKLGRFLAQIANAGVNVIIETHSDHIISGVQIAVAEDSISSIDVSVNYFFSSEDKQADVKSIKISEKGELSEWPKGFFDQTQIDYAHLFNLRRK